MKQLSVRVMKNFFFYLVELRYPPHFDFHKKKKDKMIVKAGETLQNDCLACCLHKHLDKTEINPLEWKSLKIIDISD